MDKLAVGQVRLYCHTGIYAVPRILYLDCFSGASGDMILGALLDAGLPFDELKTFLAALSLGDIEFSANRVDRGGISATKFEVLDGSKDRTNHESHTHVHHHGKNETNHHRGLAEILEIIKRSSLSMVSQERATGLFRRLIEIEADIHQMPIDRVHLHEVGAVDSIVDILGSVFALEWFSVDYIVSSPLNVGSGTVRCQHGELPVPAPATARLVEGVPIYSNGASVELLTPTGALLVTGYVSNYGGIPPMKIRAIGYGAGDRELEGMPNVLRVLLGDEDEKIINETVVVMECEIDDMNPQLYGVLMERLYEAGAFDVFYTPIQMKKNRPGTLVTVIAPVERRRDVSSVVFSETTTIGLRAAEMTRERLDRDIISVETHLGVIPFKVARRGGEVMNASPEFDHCVRIAEKEGVSVKDVQAIAMKAYLDLSN